MISELRLADLKARLKDGDQELKKKSEELKLVDLRTTRRVSVIRGRGFIHVHVV